MRAVIAEACSSNPLWVQKVGVGTLGIVARKCSWTMKLSETDGLSQAMSWDRVATESKKKKLLQYRLLSYRRQITSQPMTGSTCPYSKIKCTPTTSLVEKPSPPYTTSYRSPTLVPPTVPKLFQLFLEASVPPVTKATENREL